MSRARRRVDRTHATTRTSLLVRDAKFAVLAVLVVRLNPRTALISKQCCCPYYGLVAMWLLHRYFRPAQIVRPRLLPPPTLVGRCYCF